MAEAPDIHTKRGISLSDTLGTPLTYANVSYSAFKSACLVYHGLWFHL